MTYDPSYPFRLADGPQLDAFGRQRVSTPLRLLDEKSVAASPVLGNFASGGGSFSKPANRSSFYLTTGPVGSLARRQSRQRAIYQPGASQKVDITAIFGTPTPGIRQRYGYFDDRDGLFLQLNGTALSFVIRSYTSGVAVDTDYPRSGWQDKLDGTGPSKITLDVTKFQILSFDFQWLGGGRVRVGFVLNGVWVPVTEINHANIVSAVYMANPNQPVRWEIENVSFVAGTPVTMEAICAEVSSEGGYEARGLVLGFDTDGTVKAVNGVNAVGELLAVRLNAIGILYGTARPIQGTVLCTTAGQFMWEVWLNATGPSDVGWSTPAGSILEYSTTRVGAYTGGVKLGCGWSIDAAGQIDFEQYLTDGLGYDINTAKADVLSIRVLNVTGNNDYHASLNMRQDA